MMGKSSIEWCEWCGNHPPRTPKSRPRACSTECYSKAKARRMPKRARACEHCSTLFVPDCDASRFCGQQCRFEGRKPRPRHCVNCGTWYTPLKRASGRRLVADKHGKTCSDACRRQWRTNDVERRRKISAAFSGANHWNWQGGKSKLNNVSNRGVGWQRQREKAIKRDGHCCVYCGRTRKAHRERFGRDFDVNHIVPFHNYQRASDANKLANLETCCQSCHRRNEWRAEVQMALPYADSAKRRHKGYARGEKVSTAKLKARDVRLIRDRVASGALQSDIAAEYGMHLHSINNIVRYRSWKHV